MTPLSHTEPPGSGLLLCHCHETQTKSHPRDKMVCPTSRLEPIIDRSQGRDLDTGLKWRIPLLTLETNIKTEWNFSSHTYSAL